MYNKCEQWPILNHFLINKYLIKFKQGSKSYTYIANKVVRKAAYAASKLWCVWALTLSWIYEFIYILLKKNK